MQKDLLIVRSGPDSLHEQWPGLERRSFELALSCYGGRAHTPGIPCYDDPGGKWEALHALHAREPGLFAGRSAVAVFDDDLMVSVEALEALFRFREELALGIVQLAVDPKSHVTLSITAQEPGSAYRLTNFVEVMAPCFSARMLKKLMPWFSGKRFGWGLDFVWGRVAVGHGGLGILDSHVMVHTREPGTGALYAEGDPRVECQATIRGSGFRPVTPTVFERVPLPRAAGRMRDS